MILIYSKQLGNLKYTRKVYENIGFSQIPAWLIKMFRKRFENENVHSDEDKRQVMHHIVRQRYFLCLHL